MVIQCKIMGEISSAECLECFLKGLAKIAIKPASRVLCKKDNAVEDSAVNKGLQ